MTKLKDLFIIGGGINGCGIARDAAGRGYQVTLAEMEDLGGATSSSSTKLIHGGLRYLEYYDFRLVREALKEREVLWSLAPHIVRPMRFVLPHHEGMRPWWMLRLGLFLYDNLGGRKELPATSLVDMARDEAGAPLKPLFTRGFEYSDCWVDDARLVVLNAMDARAKGADILVRTKLVSARFAENIWHLETQDQRTGERLKHRARMLINAAGPWVDTVIQDALAVREERNVRLVQGSHIVVPKLFDHARSYIFQNGDGRIFFAIPYESDFTLIGTTDRDFSGDIRRDTISASPEEIDYLCMGASDYFKESIRPDQVVWSYSGVRPLYDDGASEAKEATRDYVLKQDEKEYDNAVVHVIGGKITTYRKLAETVLDRVERKLGALGPEWTGEAPLPGGDFQIGAFDHLAKLFAANHAYLTERHIRRMLHAYGNLLHEMFAEVHALEDLGHHFGADLYEIEVRYLMAHEWAITAEDILYRRTKCGLHMDEAQREALQAFIDEA